MDTRVEWVIGQMERCLHRRIGVADYARAVNLSPSRFAHVFCEATGLPPARYLQALRLDRARQLLERSFLSVKEVMAQVGYSDPSHFSRDFSRHHGMAPSRVRSEGNTTGARRPDPQPERPTVSRIRQATGGGSVRRVA